MSIVSVSVNAGSIISVSVIVSVTEISLPQCRHLYVEATKHHHYLIFTIALWPLPLYLLGQSKQWLIKGDHWCLSRIQVFHSILHDVH